MQPEWHSALFGRVRHPGGPANKEGQIRVWTPFLEECLAARQAADQPNAHCGSREATLNRRRFAEQLAARCAHAAEGEEADEARWHGNRGGELP